MHTKTVLAVPLSTLFTSLLSGCPLYPSCADDTVPIENQVELTPEEFEQWQQGMTPGATGGPATSTSGSPGGSTGPSDGSGSPDGSGDGTGAGTTSTTGAGEGESSTGVLLSDEDVCTAVCNQNFGPDLESCSVDEQADVVVITCNNFAYCVGGRGHACVRPLEVAAGPSAGSAWLVRLAHDEAASVHAFRVLARELAALDAPAELLAELESAALDEVRHAAITSSLASRRGAEPTPPVRVTMPERSPLELAIENAVEGCVRETWAALLAAHQARHAVDPAVRAAFTEIAADEARHAELAWALDAWLSERLDVAGRAKVAAARRSAALELVARVGTATDDPSLLELGMPEARVASHLCAALDDALWSRAA